MHRNRDLVCGLPVVVIVIGIGHYRVLAASGARVRDRSLLALVINVWIGVYGAAGIECRLVAALRGVLGALRGRAVGVIGVVCLVNLLYNSGPLVWFRIMSCMCGT